MPGKVKFLPVRLGVGRILAANLKENGFEGHQVFAISYGASACFLSSSQRTCSAFGHRVFAFALIVLTSFTSSVSSTCLRMKCRNPGFFFASCANCGSVSQ